MLSRFTLLDSARYRYLSPAAIAAALGVATLCAPSLSPAAPEPPTPNFPAAIDGFVSYAAQTTCDPTNKPGVVDFRDLMLDTYPSSTNLGIIRNCSSGGTSEHKEGRAFDWGLNYNNAAQRDIANTAMNWLLKTDEHGNACALARRFGIMYFIWNSQIWGGYRAPNSSCATAGWKAYTGSNPHTDHIHLSWGWAGARKQTSWWSAPLPTNQPPKGYLDSVNCERIGGWSQDVDTATTPNDVHLYFGGPAGDPNATGVPMTADQYRMDLCDAIGSCEHGFEVASPLSLHDGQDHPVHAYGIDSAGGANAELSSSPSSLRCAPNVPDGVLRHVPNAATFGAWGFSYFWDVMPVDDALIAARDAGELLGDHPTLARSDDGAPEVFVIDGSIKRHVPSGDVIETWGFDWNKIETWLAADLAALEQGPDVRDRPVLVQGSGDEVYLVDDPLPGEGTGVGGAGGSTGGSAWGSGGSAGSAPWDGSAGDDAGGAAGAGGEGAAANGIQTRVIGSGPEGCACRSVGAAPADASGLGGLSLLLGVGLLGGAWRRRESRRA